MLDKLRTCCVHRCLFFVGMMDMDTDCLTVFQILFCRLALSWEASTQLS